MSTELTAVSTFGWFGPNTSPLAIFTFGWYIDGVGVFVFAFAGAGIVGPDFGAPGP